MKLFLPGPLPDHARNIMRRIGYSEQRKRDGQVSFVKRASQGSFPRYHAYVEDRDGGLQINLHVDQKEATYAGSHAHSGEYDGPLVEQEMNRIQGYVRQMTPVQQTKPALSANSKKKGFWGTLLSR